MTAPTEPDTNCDRWTWERFIRGARLTGMIPAQGKRGAVSATTFKAIAFTWASYANPDGSNVFPGVATVAVAAEVSFKTAKAVTAKLAELGLLKRVAPTSRRARRFDLYRLALPEDILEHVTILDPDQMTKAGEAMRLAYRGKPKSDSVGVPEDPSPDADPEDDSPDDDESGGGSTGPTYGTGVGSSGAAVGGPADCGTNPVTVPSVSTNPSGRVLRTDVAVVGTHEDHLISEFDQSQKPETCGRRNCRNGFVEIGINRVRCRICPLPNAAEG